MLNRLLSVLGSIASLFGCVFVFHQPGSPYTTVQAVFLGLALVFSACAIAAEFRSYWQDMPRKYKTPQAIRDYLFRWISVGGRVCIFSNDMSWVQDEEMKEMLRSKAEKDELTIVLPSPIPLTEELKQNGAHIITYAPLKYTPKSRFTIINDGRDGAQIAIGRRIRDVHCIDEFAEGSHPVFAVASDLIEILRQYNSNRRTPDRLGPKCE